MLKLSKYNLVNTYIYTDTSLFAGDAQVIKQIVNNKYSKELQKDLNKLKKDGISCFGDRRE